jgi:hypothetical protein
MSTRSIFDELQSEFTGGSSNEAHGVSWSGDLARILGIPRRPVDSFPTPKATVGLAKSVASCECSASFGYCIKSLNATQLRALEEISTARGGLILAGTGHGKTVISLLAPIVLGAKRTVLLIPPNLKTQLVERDYPQISAHWNLPQLSNAPFFQPGKPILYIVTYSDLSQTKNSELLKNIAPDLIVADEAHSLKDKTATRTKRFLRLFKELPERPMFVALSGTMTSKSIKDYAHLSHLALRENTPLPVHWPTLDQWSGAIDPLKFNIPAGQLRKLCGPEETVRQGFRRRLVETPGVIATSDSSIGTALTFSERAAEPLPLVLSKQLDHLRETWERPDGERLTDIIEYHRTATEMACGFYYQWVFKNGENETLINEWLRVRKEYNTELREKLKRGSVNMDSVALVEAAAERFYAGYKGTLPVWKCETWNEWIAIRDQVQPESEPVWVSKWLVENAFQWAEKTPKGIVWYMHQCFGDELEKLGLPRFGANSDAEIQRFVDAARNKPAAFAASIFAHSTGKNLQFAHNQNLVCVGLSDAARWEQLIARTHRPGQPEDEVKVFVYRHTQELRESFKAAIGRARYRRDTTVNTDKLCIGSYEFKI